MFLVFHATRWQDSYLMEFVNITCSDVIVLPVLQFARGGRI